MFHLKLKIIYKNSLCFKEIWPNRVNLNRFAPNHDIYEITVLKNKANKWSNVSHQERSNVCNNCESKQGLDIAILDGYIPWRTNPLLSWWWWLPGAATEDTWLRDTILAHTAILKDIRTENCMYSLLKQYLTLYSSQEKCNKYRFVSNHCICLENY